MRPLAAALLAALALGAAAGRARAADTPVTGLPTPAFTIGVESAGGEVAVAPGTVFAVELESASGGGYLWSVSRADPAVLEVVGEETLPPAAGRDAPALGAPAGQRFLLLALAPGAAVLELALARPWRPAEVLRTFTVRVLVAAPAD